jgi:hypothetical protein
MWKLTEKFPPPQNLADQLTLFKPGWTDYAPHTTASSASPSPDSKNYLHLCHTSLKFFEIFKRTFFPTNSMAVSPSSSFFVVVHLLWVGRLTEEVKFDIDDSPLKKIFLEKKSEILFILFILRIVDAKLTWQLF